MKTKRISTIISKVSHWTRIIGWKYSPQSGAELFLFGIWWAEAYREGMNEYCGRLGRQNSRAGKIGGKMNALC